MAKKPKVHAISAKKKAKGPPHMQMMEGAAERGMPSGMMAGRPGSKKKKR